MNTMTGVDSYHRQPRIGDAFGELYLSCVRGENPVEVYERDDGYLFASPAAKYLAPPEEWLPFERRAVDSASGHVLDIGCGAGRVTLYLQERGLPIVGLDTSPGAVEAAKRRGVRQAVVATVYDHAATRARYDTFLLCGNNLGLLENARNGRAFLVALGSMASPKARIIATGTDPYGLDDPARRRYIEDNRQRGRMGGQARIRIRYRDLTTEWFEYLYCSLDELAELAADTGWLVGDAELEDYPRYTVTLHWNGR